MEFPSNNWHETWSSWVTNYCLCVSSWQRQTV